MRAAPLAARLRVEVEVASCHQATRRLLDDEVLRAAGARLVQVGRRERHGSERRGRALLDWQVRGQHCSVLPELERGGKRSIARLAAHGHELLVRLVLAHVLKGARHRAVVKEAVRLV